MGRKPYCSNEVRMKRGAWTSLEDQILKDYINIHGEGKWGNISKKVERCGKSCRLRWLNYLRPDIKRGNISSQEEDLILRLHKLLGNRWSLIAGRLPGRTDNEIKNYWNTTLAKKLKKQQQKQEDKSKDDEKKKQNDVVTFRADTIVITEIIEQESTTVSDFPRNNVEMELTSNTLSENVFGKLPMEFVDDETEVWKLCQLDNTRWSCSFDNMFSEGSSIDWT